jgi:hypothetical protein
MTPAAARGVDGVDGRPPDGSKAEARGRAFGIEIESNVPLASLPGSEDRFDRQPTTVELVSAEALERAWGPEAPVRVSESRQPDGSLVLAIDRDERGGYLLTTGEFGDYLLSADGLRLLCAPEQLGEWQRERVLMARVLPLAATLRGFEVFHASGVALEDAAIGIVGPSHVGKTSVAVNLVLDGASFMTDDLLALEAGDDEVMAHPGAAMMGIRPVEHNLIDPERLRQLGRFVERRDKFFAEVERVDRPLPLKLVYFLERRRSTRELAIEELTEPDPRMLLASSFFNRIVHSSERLRSQLELCAQISHTVRLCRVSVPPSVGAKALAGSLAQHATATLG